MSKQQEWEDFEMPDEQPIDWVGMAKKLLAGWKVIAIATGAGLLLGLLVAIGSTKQYTVTTVMVPQVGSKTSAGGLSSLAALAGIDLSSTMTTGELSPIVYPQIVSSTPFKLELMNTKFKFEEVAEPVSLYDYYTQYQKTSVVGVIKKYTFGLPGIILEAIKGKKEEPVYDKNTASKLIALTKEQSNISGMLDNSVMAEVDAKQGYLTLTVTMEEPLLTAQVAQKAQEILQREIIRFKVQKAQADLDFIQERYDELKSKAEGYQMNIAIRSDKYKDLISNVPQVQSTRMQTQYGIANTVFQEIAKQLEQAKIQVKKDTPVFTIVQPVVIPNEPSGMGRMMKMIIFIFLGAAVGAGIVLTKDMLTRLKEKWKEKE
jgi:uncharacterized protein involved in exopolysaccharide biosynthesis